MITPAGWENTQSSLLWRRRVCRLLALLPLCLGCSADSKPSTAANDQAQGGGDPLVLDNYKRAITELLSRHNFDLSAKAIESAKWEDLGSGRYQLGENWIVNVRENTFTWVQSRDSQYRP